MRKITRRLIPVADLVWTEAPERACLDIAEVVTVREWFRKTRRINIGIPDWDDPLDVVLGALRRRMDALADLHKLAREAEFSGPFLHHYLTQVHTDEREATRKQEQLRQALEQRRLLEAVDGLMGGPNKWGLTT